MRFRLYTLIDITRTGARRGEDPKKYKQQQNYLTVLNTIGLRVNPTVKKDPVNTDEHPSFGKNYNNKQKVWMLEFDIEYGATSVELLETDFGLVPFFVDLDETATFSNAVFNTTDSNDKNIVFEQVE